MGNDPALGGVCRLNPLITLPDRIDFSDGSNDNIACLRTGYCVCVRVCVCVCGQKGRAEKYGNRTTNSMGRYLRGNDMITMDFLIIFFLFLFLSLGMELHVGYLSFKRQMDYYLQNADVLCFHRATRDSLDVTTGSVTIHRLTARSFDRSKISKYIRKG